MNSKLACFVRERKTLTGHGSRKMLVCYVVHFTDNTFHQGQFFGFSVLDFLVNEESLPRRSAGCPLKIRRQLNQGGVDPANEGQLQGWQAN